MYAKNKVIAGDYVKQRVVKEYGFWGDVVIDGELFSNDVVKLEKSTVKSYETIDKTTRKSAIGAVSRGWLASFVFGRAGLLAGLAAGSIGTYTIAIYFSDGKKSLIEVDEKIYLSIVKQLF